MKSNQKKTKMLILQREKRNIEADLGERLKLKKGEDPRITVQNKKNGLEEQRQVEENTKEETAETEVNSKGISNNKCDLLDTERAIEINDSVQNIKFTEGRSHT